MGYIIVIEGSNGSGKQTQSTKLYQKLKDDGVNVVKMSLPNYDSASSGPVKMYLSGELCNNAYELDAYQTSVLYAVDRLCTHQKELKEHYNNGGVIVFDRYVQSNMLHQACKIKNLNERDKFLEWLDNFEFNLLKLPRPDKIIFLDVPPEKSNELASGRKELKSGATKDIEEENFQHVVDSYNSGKYVAEKYNWNIVNCMNENGMRDIEDIHKEIVKLVGSDFKKR
ncbi:MAG: deoxynucleoside kinase [Clostridia bacterium]|nr:deoxynucleoside kinase [Clostridia bacterium]